MSESLQPTGIEFVEGLLGRGRYTFTKAEAKEALGRSEAAVSKSLYRLEKSGWLVSPHTGFFVIVDPQHRSARTLPPEWFIHNLMADMKKQYYVGLLSAAQIHGAAHHRPQEFQVVIPERKIRAITTGNVRVQFYGKGKFEKSKIVDVKTVTGYINVSTPETTAWDLVRYSSVAGGLENVAVVLSELAEKIDADALYKTVMENEEVIVAQRLGFLLEKLQRVELVNRFSAFVKGAPYRFLDSGSKKIKKEKDSKWRLFINTELELDL